MKKEHPTLRAFLLECSEMPPYADAIRAATGLPVYDAITGREYYVSSPHVWFIGQFIQPFIVYLRVPSPHSS